MIRSFPAKRPFHTAWERIVLCPFPSHRCIVAAMWLLPHFSAVSAAAVRVYYRASVDGESVPSTGPVLLVGNHPNSLFDPAFVAWVAKRPVRFLAKAPLFTNPLVGWLVRGSGSIPVYRRQDDATLMGRNDDTFRAVHDALRAEHDGDARLGRRARDIGPCALEERGVRRRDGAARCAVAGHVALGEADDARFAVAGALDGRARELDRLVGRGGEAQVRERDAEDGHGPSG